MAETGQSGPENLHTLVSVIWCILCFQGITFFKNIFNFTTAGEWDCVAAVSECLPVPHFSVDFIFLSFGINGFIVELLNYRRVTNEA